LTVRGRADQTNLRNNEFYECNNIHICSKSNVIFYFLIVAEDCFAVHCYFAGQTTVCCFGVKISLLVSDGSFKNTAFLRVFFHTLQSFL